MRRLPHPEGGNTGRPCAYGECGLILVVHAELMYIPCNGQWLCGLDSAHRRPDQGRSGRTGGKRGGSDPTPAWTGFRSISQVPGTTDSYVFADW